MDDDSLLTSTRLLVDESNFTEADLLLHLGEVDARRLYAARAFSSMYKYCTDALGFSHYCALDRVCVARLVRRLPRVLPPLRDGRLNVTGLPLLHGGEAATKSV